MNSIHNICRKQFFLSFQMMGNLIEQCPEEIWNIKAGGYVFWQQILHALYGANYWMRQANVDILEPFAERKVYPELEKEPEGNVSRDEMLNYKDEVKKLCESFFEDKDDEWFSRASVLCDKLTNMDVVFMQIRHIQYHIGHCDSILRERGFKAVEWLE
jgi:hypothetical protein